jgi:hypothetical protein
MHRWIGLLLIFGLLDNVTHEHPSSSRQTNPQKATEPSMYGIPSSVSSHERKSKCGDKLPKMSEEVSSPNFSPSPRSQYFLSKGELRSMWPPSLPRLDDKKSGSPSGISRPALFPLEETQRHVLNDLIQKRHKEFSAADIVSGGKSDSNNSSASRSTTKAVHFSSPCRECPIIGSPPKKRKHCINPVSKSWRCAEPNGESNNVMTDFTNHHHPSRFSFDVDEDAFTRTSPSDFGANGPNSVNKTFSPSDWDAKFEASHFAPETLAASGPRPQSGSRTRGRSPTKSRPMQAHVDPVSAESSPGGTKFSEDEWAGTFKPQTFMPPSAPSGPTAPNSSRVPKKSRVPSIRLTMGTAAVVDDGDTSDEKPLFKGRNPSVGDMPTAPSPDPMDVDTPPPSSTTPVPSAAEEPKVSAKDVSTGQRQTPVDTEYLKVNFEDLKIEDVITLPKPPTPPKIPAALLPATADTRDAYLERFKTYMHDWDLFTNQIMLYLVEQKNRNNTLGATRWLDGDGISLYRKGLQVDSVVLKCWTDAIEKHEKNMKDCQVLKATAIGEATGTSADQARVT